MDFQVKINDEKETIFTNLNGKCTKSTTSSNMCTTNIFEYKNLNSMKKAINKVITKDSVVKGWNKDGTPNKNFKI
tara:strand:+ start:502 stop:726 length:225 start_codon:yes stop_codon:yes gene_type:complete